MGRPAEQLASKPVLDVANIRAAFPLIQSSELAQGLHYLDNAATTQKPTLVLDAMDSCYRDYYSPIHRGLYPLAEEATRRFELARQQLSEFIGAPSNDVIFTHSATESINMVAQGWGQQQVKAGDIIWVSRMEHHANYLPWQRLCQQTGAELRFIELNEDNQLDLNAANGLFGPQTALIAVCHVSNVLGLENPVRQICHEASQHGIPVLVDAAQSVAHLPIDVTDLGCDFLTFSAHKMYGPTGIGLLYARQQRQQEMEPLLLGGGMVDEVGEGNQPSSWTEGPLKFEAGSPNLPAAVGFAAAANFLTGFDRNLVHQHLTTLANHAHDRLAEIPGVQIIPANDNAEVSLVSFVMDGIHPHDIAHIAGENGVAIRAGHHCAQPLMRALDLVSTARVSFAIYNDLDDVDALLKAVQEAQRIFS